MEQLDQLNRTNNVQPIHLSNPHPYSVSLDLFNGFDGVDSSYYHQIKTATPRLKSLASKEEITIEDALFVKILGGDVEVRDENTGTSIIYNGEDTLLEYGFQLSNRMRIRAIGQPVSLIWTKAELFLNDSAIHPRTLCAIHFHPSTTTFYAQPLRWITQDGLGKKSTEPIPFREFGPHFKNEAYLLPLDKRLSQTDSFQLTLPAKSSLSLYLYSKQEGMACQPCKEEQPEPCEEIPCPVVCPKATLPLWLILLLLIGAMLLLFFKFHHQTT